MHLRNAFHAPGRRLLSVAAITSRPRSLCPPYFLNFDRSNQLTARSLPSPRPFTTISPLLAKARKPGPKGAKKRKRAPEGDRRIRAIRYFLKHPTQPRPLRFSRNRALRHWTIHRAWQLYQAKQRTATELALERQFNSMREACEALRLIGEDGLAIPQGGKSVPPPGARDLKTAVVRRGADTIELDVLAGAQRQLEVGRLFRIAMLKNRVWDGVPIEYARHQTDTPPRHGWDHNWER